MGRKGGPTVVPSPTICRPMSEETAAAFANTIGVGLEEAVIETEEVPSGRRRYVISRVLGEGGMGRVIEADDRQFGRLVALKQLKTELAGAAGRRRFALEALVTGHLEHPGIPTVYERGVLGDGLPFYAMRLVRGRTLAEAMAGAKTAAERMKIVPAIERVAQTLAFAHERGVIHRDIKPENVVVGRHGETVVLDWGIAKLKSARFADPSTEGGATGKTAHSTRHGAVVGTPAYMAPEQAKGELDAIDERTDVFAIGILLYELFAGRGPYTDAGLGEVLDRAATASFVPIDVAASDAPAGIRAICKKAMARSPDDRYASAGAVAEALESFTAETLLARDSRVVQRVADVVTVIAILGVLWVGAMVLPRISSFAEQGLSAYIPFAGVLGLILSAIEWRTRGRHTLEPLTIGLAFVVFLGGIGATVGGFEHVLGNAVHLEPTDPVNARLHIEDGLYEVLGTITTTTITAALQLIVWAAVRRSTLRATSLGAQARNRLSP